MSSYLSNVTVEISELCLNIIVRICGITYFLQAVSFEFAFMCPLRWDEHKNRGMNGAFCCSTAGNLWPT